MEELEDANVMFMFYYAPLKRRHGWILRTSDISCELWSLGDILRERFRLDLYLRRVYVVLKAYFHAWATGSCLREERLPSTDDC